MENCDPIINMMETNCDVIGMQERHPTVTITEENEEMNSRLQQSINARHNHYWNTRDIRVAPKRARHLKRKQDAEKFSNIMAKRLQRNRRYNERKSRKQLLIKLLRVEEERHEQMSSSDDKEDIEDPGSECNESSGNQQSNDKRQPHNTTAILEIKDIDIDTLSSSTEQEVLLVFKELGLKPPDCFSNERGTRKYFDRMIKILTYHKIHYYEGVRTTVPHNNIEEIKKKMDNTFCQQLFEFEETMFNIHPKHCSICHQRRLNMVVKFGVCSRCKAEKFVNKFTHENRALPVWIDSETGQIHYELPEELKNLSIAEKLLIQKVSPLVPVIHIKNGVLACRGHCVSFFQDISSICDVFPKLPSEVTMVKVIRTSTTKGGDIVDRAFTVNKQKVLSALCWLKRHNHEYRNISIQTNRFDWMADKAECSLREVITIESEEIEEEENDR
jgi:hypothetical protein